MTNTSCATGDSWEQRWPREQYPALYLTADEFREHVRRREERKRILELIGDDVTEIALAVLREVRRS